MKDYIDIIVDYIRIRTKWIFKFYCIYNIGENI